MVLARWSVLALLPLAIACNGETAETDTDLGTEITGEGADLFADNCARCHGDNGQGSIVGPALTERVPGLTEADVTDIILQGSGRMDPIDEVDADQAATIATFVVASFGGE